MSSASESSHDDEPRLETQPPSIPWFPTATVIVSATPADDLSDNNDADDDDADADADADGNVKDDDDDDDSDDDNPPYLTQPPSIVNTAQTVAATSPQRPVFLNSVLLADAPELAINSRTPLPDYTVAPLPSSIVIPDYVSLAIKKELLATWGCNTPRPYQVEAIFHLVYRKVDMVYLIRKTGEGKSLVLQGMASMLKGVTISLVPLLGLGSDQQEKCSSKSSDAVEAYHLDEYRGSHAKLLIRHLRLYTREEKTTIILFVSPQQMQRNSNWYAVLRDLALRGCISAVCIDEVHSSVQNYESFRPEFKSAMDFLNQLVTISRNSTTRSHFYVRILAMSATFTISDQDAFNKLIRRQPTMVFWGEMSRRSIKFNVHVAGNPTHLLMADWTKVAGKEYPQQSLIRGESLSYHN